MKKQVVYLLIALSFSFTLKAQTTEAEYNYITTGYKVQVVEQGGDIKRGYALVDADSAYSVTFGSEGIRNASFKALYRVGEKKPCAFMMIYKRASTGFEKYYCIPTDNASSLLWDRTMIAMFTDLKSTNNIQYATTVIMGLMKFVSRLNKLI